MSATSPRNQRYMRLFAYLPLALHPGTRDVLLICYGCGVTADAFTRKSSVERIDIVDISKEVFALADSYSGINYSNPLRDPRVRADRSRRTLFPAGQPAAIRHHFGRTASAENGRFSQSLHAGIFFADAKPAEGRRNRDLLASDQSIEGGRSQERSCARFTMHFQTHRFGAAPIRTGS